jgi:hypothetical protein
MQKFILLLAFLAIPFTTPQAAEPPPKESFHLFVLVGQSNMAGRGKIDKEDNAPHPRVLMFNKEGRWSPATDPLHFDKPKIVGVGPGRAFAQAVADADPKITVGVIPCAVGGSPISAWQPGAYYSATQSHPWDDAIRRSKAAIRDGTLKGILWHQGESDSKSGAAEAYEGKLHNPVARFRRELDAPDVPFIAGQMGIFEERPWNAARKQVDRAHRELPAKVDRTGFASADGLGHKGDEIHFSTEAARELGRRYYEAWRALSGGR